MTMSTPAPTAPQAPSGPGRAGAARSGAPPGELSFATLLENDRARTATAEGHQSEAQRQTRAERRDDLPAARPERDPKAQDDREQRGTTPRPEARTEPQAPAVDPTLQSPAP